MSTNFIAEEWDTRNTGTEPGAQGETENEMLAPEQIAALVGGMLLNQHIEEEKLRRKPGGENGAETNRWREAARRDALRRM